jgi:hypothetical protein
MRYACLDRMFTTNHPHGYEHLICSVFESIREQPHDDRVGYIAIGDVISAYLHDVRGNMLHRHILLQASKTERHGGVVLGPAGEIQRYCLQPVQESSGRVSITWKIAPCRFEIECEI